jgi:hypothetical protein
MPCDTKLKPGQTISERIAEIKKMVETLSSALVAGRVKARVGEEGGIVFDGLTDAERNNVTDACAFRRIMVSGSALAKQRIAQAEALAGRTVNRQAVGQGLHSHDGGKTWHHGH